MESMPASARPVTVGVDTHLETHVAAVIDQTGRLCGTQEFPASTRGYVALVTWAEGFGAVERVGVEGTGTFGPALPALSAPMGWRWSRWPGLTAASGGATASRIRSTPRPPPGRPWPGWRLPSPKPVRARSR
jgi:Transposase